jgi:hypothetical protein
MSTVRIWNACWQKGKGSGSNQRHIMELNPAHPIVARLHHRYLANNEDPSLESSFSLRWKDATYTDAPHELGQWMLPVPQPGRTWWYLS